MRHPVGVTTDMIGINTNRTIVVCDDGTLWSWMEGQNRWVQWESVPGTPATEKKSN